MHTVHIESCSVFDVVGEGDDRRWLNCASQDRGGVTEVLDSTWIDTAPLPRLPHAPERLRCLTSQREYSAIAFNQEATVFLTWMPLFSDARYCDQSVLEIDSSLELTIADKSAVKCLLRVHQNVRSMLDYSECDALTGLLNRRSFDDAFRKAAGSGATTDRSPDKVADNTGYWLAMIDIDHFKKVNDGHGHLVGDDVLRGMSRLLKDCFRVVDRVYRFGGEEFVVMLRAPDHQVAFGALERFRRHLQTFEFPTVGTVTASVGLTEILPDDSPSTACYRADQAVYHAKRNGRNRVCAHADLVNLGLLPSTVKASDVESFWENCQRLN